MTIPTTAVKMDVVAFEFGAPNYAMSSLYRTNGYVPTDQPDIGYGTVPTGGAIDLAVFRGATIRAVPTTTPFGSTSSGGTWTITYGTTDGEGVTTYTTISGWGYPLIANIHWIGANYYTLGGVFSGTSLVADSKAAPNFTITNPNKGRSVQFAINTKFFISTHQVMRFNIYRSDGTLIAQTPYYDYNRLTGVGAGVGGSGALTTDGYWQAYLTGYDTIPPLSTYTYYGSIDSYWNGDYNYGGYYPSGMLYAQAVQNAVV
jgi:hypothetical protein